MKTMIMRSAYAWLIVCLLPVASARAAENIRVAYPSLNTSVYCLIVAEKEGYLKEEGLALQLLNIRGEIAIRSALAGEIDYFTNAGSALAAAVRAVPVRIVTVFQDKPGWDLIAPAGHQVHPAIAWRYHRRHVAGRLPGGGGASDLAAAWPRAGERCQSGTMGGDSVRLPALQAKAIQATLFNTGMSLQAQKEGFTKLAAAADYASVIEGGLAAAQDRIKQNPDKVVRFIRAAVKGLQFFVAKREAAIKTMMDQ